jgi:hypothetical protein
VEHFERNHPTELRIVRDIDGAHATKSKSSLDLKPTDLVTRLQHQRLLRADRAPGERPAGPVIYSGPLVGASGPLTQNPNDITFRGPIPHNAPSGRMVALTKAAAEEHFSVLTTNPAPEFGAKLRSHPGATC